MCDGPIIYSEGVVDRDQPIEGVDSVRTNEVEVYIAELLELHSPCDLVYLEVSSSDSELPSKRMKWGESSSGSEGNHIRIPDLDEIYDLGRILHGSLDQEHNNVSSNIEGRIYNSGSDDRLNYASLAEESDLLRATMPMPYMLSDYLADLEPIFKRKKRGVSSIGSEGRIYHLDNMVNPALDSMSDLGHILPLFCPVANGSLDQEHDNVSLENEGSNDHIDHIWMQVLDGSLYQEHNNVSLENEGSNDHIDHIWMQVLDNSGSNDHIRVPGSAFTALVALHPSPHEVHGSLDQEDNLVPSRYVGRLHDWSNYDGWTRYSDPPAVGIGERWIGKLQISRNKIGIGSNGTVVYEGWYEGRAVAVKRIILHYGHIAINEIEHLIKSDRHPNIVRYYGKESDEEFFYLALERCNCSLYDLIQTLSDSSNISLDHQRSHSIRNDMQGVQLWSADGFPTPLLMKLMRDMVSGLIHLHGLRLMHRDLKPQNVLITKNTLLAAHLSDMGISKCLPEDRSFSEYHATGCGSSGWRAPEQLLKKCQRFEMDVFSLGLILFFCVTRGKHPFGNRNERDLNIEKNQMNLSSVEFMQEAHDLFSRMLNWDPKLRPKAVELLHHPFFWSSEMRMSFLRDTSDRVQLEAKRAPNSNLLKKLERKAPLVFHGNWDSKIEHHVFLADIRKRHYNYSLLRDLLRVVRNKFGHYIELSEEIQELLGPFPDGYDKYFTKRFPRLLMVSYRVVSRFLKQEESFRRYFGS